MSQPLVNVYIPTYEPKPDHLKAALDTLKSQALQDWTALIHDDASETNVRAMIEPFLKDPRITFKKSNTRLGIGGNWNACLQHGSSPFIAYLFQDDTWNPAYLQQSVTILHQDSSIAFTAAHHRYVRDDHQALPRSFTQVTNVRQALLTAGKHTGSKLLLRWLWRGLHPNIIGEPSFVVMRRSMIEMTGPFDASMRQCLDTDMWTRLLKTGNMYWIDQDMGSFLVHAESASTKNKQSGRGSTDRLRCLWKISTRTRHLRLRNAAQLSLIFQVPLMAMKFVSHLIHI